MVKSWKTSTFAKVTSATILFTILFYKQSLCNICSFRAWLQLHGLSTEFGRLRKFCCVIQTSFDMQAVHHQKVYSKAGREIYSKIIMTGCSLQFELLVTATTLATLCNWHFLEERKPTMVPSQSEQSTSISLYTFCRLIVHSVILHGSFEQTSSSFKHANNYQSLNLKEINFGIR